MTKKLLIIISILFSMTALPSFTLSAQDLEEVVVTGSRHIGRSENIEVPGTTLVIRADNFIQSIKIKSDSREYIKRREEIISTLTKLMAKVSDTKGYRLVEIRDENILPLKIADQVKIRSGRQRDTSFIDLSIRRPLKGNTIDGHTIVREIEAFIKTIKGNGRAKIQLGSKAELSIIKPQQYRAQLLKKVTTEINRLVSSLDGDYQAVITGIHQPLYWRQSTLTDMRLYIPYRYIVIPKGFTGNLQY